MFSPSKPRAQVDPAPHSPIVPTIYSAPPEIDPAVVIYLETVFKAQLSRHYDLRDYDRQVGQQEVIAHLKALLEQQDNR